MLADTKKNKVQMLRFKGENRKVCVCVCVVTRSVMRGCVEPGPMWRHAGYTVLICSGTGRTGAT